MPSRARGPLPKLIIPPSGSACGACVLRGRCASTHIPPGTGYFAGLGSYSLTHTGLMIVGDHLGASDSHRYAFIGTGGSLLRRIIERRLNLSLDQFYFETALRCHPTAPIKVKRGNRVEKSWWLNDAATHCYGYLNEAIERKKPTTFFALGDLAFEQLTGIAMSKPLNMNAVRGYVFPERLGRGWVIPSHHPDFIQDGKFELATTLELDLLKALRVAREGYAYEEGIECLMDPPMGVWDDYVRSTLDELRAPDAFDAIDIETPYKRGKRDAEDGDESETDDPSYTIDRIAFCANSKRAASVVASAQYLPGIKALLSAEAMSVFWNRPYDRPRIRHNWGQDLLPLSRCFDSMDFFHCRFNHLPRKLGFATSLLPRSFGLKLWKNLSASDPAYYSAMDVVSLHRNHLDLCDQLRDTHQMGVVNTIMIELDPALEYMQQQGMPVDVEAKDKLSADLAILMKGQSAQMNAAVPDEIKTLKVWKSEKAAKSGLERLKAGGEVSESAQLEPIAATRETKVCSVCGEMDVTKPHVTKKTIEDLTPVEAQGGLF